ARHLPRAPEVLHDGRAQDRERGLQRGRRVLLPARGDQDAGGAAMAMTEKQPAPPWGAWLLPAYLGSLVLVFIGERIVGTDSVRYAFSALGALGLAATTALRYYVMASAGDPERRAAERVLAHCSAGGLTAIGLYFTTTETGRNLLGVAAAKPETRARVEG